MTESIVKTRVGAMEYVAPSGPLHDDSAIAGLQAAVASCVAAHRVQLVLDLAAVPLVNGRALEVMLDSHTRLSALGGGLRMLNPNPLLRDVMRVTGVAGAIGEADAVTPAAPARLGDGRKLGDILLANGVITAERLKEAALLQQQLGRRLGHILVDKGFVAEADLLKALGIQLDVPHVTLRAGLYDPAALALLDKEVARRLAVLPMFRVHDTLTLATCDPQAVPALDEVASRTGCRVRPVLARREEILKHLELLVSVAIASILIAPLVLALRSSVSAQASAVAVNDVNQQARFALQRMAAKVRSTPAATTLGAKAANTTGDWLAPIVYCLNGAGAVIETNTFDTLCNGSSVIASGVTAFSVQTFNAGAGAAPVIELQLTLTGAQGAVVAVTSRTRLGGGTL